MNDSARRRAADLALVAAGGFVGTLLRASLAAALPASHSSWPWATFGVNVIGAFALGLLLALVARESDAGWRRRVRLGVGTGALGGFTTYSSLAVEIVQRDQAMLGLVYAVVSVGLGVAAALAGLRVGRGRR